MFGRGYISKIMCEQQEIFDFLQGCSGHGQEAQIVPFCIPGGTFDDIRGHAGCCAPQLAGNAKLLVAGELLSGFVYPQGEVMGALPGYDFAVIAHFKNRTVGL